MRVLTYNSHQPYLHLLAAALPWTIGVITPRMPGGNTRIWEERIRPLPSNVRIYGSPQEAAQTAPWDWILAHNVHDLMDSSKLPFPKVFLVHGTLSGRILQDASTIDRDRYLEKLRILLEASRCHTIYVSKLKQRDWGIPGKVVLPGIDVDSYGGYRGEIEGILQVGNHFRERGALLGYEAHRAACDGIPSLVLGENPGWGLSRVASSWDDLKETYRAYRVYLYTAVAPYEDGYNLALLEAMATGMPVASTAHPTSPIEDGLDGIVAASGRELREKVSRLLKNPDEARRMGAAARVKVRRLFSLEAFGCAWEEVARELR